MGSTLSNTMNTKGEEKSNSLEIFVELLEPQQDPTWPNKAQQLLLQTDQDLFGQEIHLDRNFRWTKSLQKECYYPKRQFSEVGWLQFHYFGLNSMTSENSF